MLLHESLALSVTEAEEHNIHLVKRQVGGKLQVRIAIEAFVNGGDIVTRMALTVGKDDGGLRVVDQHTSTRINSPPV